MFGVLRGERGSCLGGIDYSQFLREPGILFLVNRVHDADEL